MVPGGNRAEGRAPDRALPRHRSSRAPGGATRHLPRPAGSGDTNRGRAYPSQGVGCRRRAQDHRRERSVVISSRASALGGEPRQPPDQSWNGNRIATPEATRPDGLLPAGDATEDGAVVAVLDRVVQRIFRASLLLRADGDVERPPRTETATEELAAALGDLQSTLLLHRHEFVLSPREEPAEERP